MKKIHIEGMSCAHCVAHVTETLTALEGITAVKEVSLSGKYAIIEGTAADDAIKAAIDDAGYDVVNIE